MRNIDEFKKFCDENNGVWPPVFFWEESDDYEDDYDSDDSTEWVFL